MGAVASVLVCIATLWLTLRKLGRQSVRELLVGEINAGRDGFHSVPEIQKDQERGGTHSCPVSSVVQVQPFVPRRLVATTKYPPALVN